LKTIIKIYFAALLFSIAPGLFSQTYTWQPLGNGLNNGTSDTVKAITSFNGKVIYGGNFSQAGGINAQNIAAYDPVTNTWSALGAGVNGEVKALFVSGSELIVGGSFTQAGITNANNVAKWNGTNWSAMGSGLNDDVNALIVYSGSVIAGGNFSMAGGNNNVARWNGSNWVSMGNGLTGSGDRVNALALFQGNLVAGGRFEESGSTNISNVAKWNGSSWSAFKNDVFDDDVNALIVYNNDLFVGGDFTHIGGSDRRYIARWSSNNWVSVGGGLEDGPVEAFSTFKNTLIAGGNFRETGTGLFVDRIAGWNGSVWSRLLTGHNDHVYALHTRNSTDTMLYSGGEFTTAGGKWTYFAAKWGPVDNISVSGQVRYADNNSIVVGGKIKILRMDVITREIIVVDSTNVDNFGNYTLNRVPRRDSTLRVMIFPDDELIDQGTDTGFVPTYYPSTIQWLSAGVLYASTNMVNVNINVIRKNAVAASGSIAAGISGKVYLNIAPELPGTGFPFLRGSVLYLKKDTSFVSFAVTNENEQYSFTGVPPGNYQLTVQRLGYETETKQITVGFINLDTVNYYLDTMNVIGIVNISSNIPDEFSLGQNYPNPFNPVTKIRFAIRNAAFAELKIFDVLGREVKTLVNEKLTAGEYEYSFNAISLPSGVYFYRLNTESFSMTKKMVLIR